MFHGSQTHSAHTTTGDTMHRHTFVHRQPTHMIDLLDNLLTPSPPPPSWSIVTNPHPAATAKLRINRHELDLAATCTPDPDDNVYRTADHLARTLGITRSKALTYCDTGTMLTRMPRTRTALACGAFNIDLLRILAELTCTLDDTHLEAVDTELATPRPVPQLHHRQHRHRLHRLPDHPAHRRSHRRHPHHRRHRHRPQHLPGHRLHRAAPRHRRRGESHPQLLPQPRHRRHAPRKPGTHRHRPRELDAPGHRTDRPLPLHPRRPLRHRNPESTHRRYRRHLPRTRLRQPRRHRRRRPHPPLRQQPPTPTPAKCSHCADAATSSKPSD